jgi:hypothetical protein
MGSFCESNRVTGVVETQDLVGLVSEEIEELPSALLRTDAQARMVRLCVPKGRVDRQQVGPPREVVFQTERLLVECGEVVVPVFTRPML